MMDLNKFIEIAFKKCYEHKSGKIFVPIELVRQYKSIFPESVLDDDELVRGKIRQLLCDSGWNK